MGIARNTVRKYLREGCDGETKARKRRTAPARNAIEERAAELLEAWSKETTAKQRITATRLHEELRSEGKAIGVTTVRHVVREWRRQRVEAFVPLTYRPGEVAQVDFFEVVVEIGGERRKAWMFLMRLMYSGRDFAWLYDRADQVSFLDAHVRAFAHFGGTPQRCVYDNLKAAVTKVLQPGRELSPRFAAMAAHYVFEPCFARPGEGHDKGGVESRGKNIRLQHLTPIPKGRSIEDVAAYLLTRLDEQAKTKVDRDRGQVMVRFEEERSFFVQLPAHPFEARRCVTCSVRRTARIQIEGAHYSV
jgi:transposase